MPLGQLAEATSIGTLAAFAIVNFGVIALWRARPELERTFKVPLMPLMPILGVIFCVYLISSLAIITWVVFFLWMALGLAIYFGYSVRHSTAPDHRPIAKVDQEAATLLRGRPVGAGTVIGVIILAIVGVAALLVGPNGDGLAVWQKGMWYLTALLCLIGIVMALRGLMADRSAQSQAETGDYVSATGGMRAAIMSIAVWLLIPGLLAVLSVTFASSGAGDVDATAEGQPPAVAQVAP